jgi:hypothetical protein
VQFRLTLLLSVIVLTGCTAEELRAPDEAAAEAEVIATKAAPVVGTWTWAASDTRIGDIDLGREQFVFRDDGTYAVVSKGVDGSSECYEGTFTWSNTLEPGHGTIVFKNNRIRNPDEGGFGRDVYLRGDDTLDFEEGGTYRRTGPVLDIRCP